MSVNWGLAQGPNAFENALSRGMQMGQMFKQQREEKEYKNALAAYDPANAETLKPIMAANPEMGFRLQGQQQEQAARAQQAQQQQAQQRRADLPMMVKLLETATDEQTYQRNLQVANQYGLDTSNLPPAFDPAWRDTNLKSMKALTTPEGQEVMSGLGKEAMDMGFKPGTPEFQAKVTQMWQDKGAIPYTGANGETRLYVPGRGVPTAQPITEGTVIENAAGEKMVLRNGKWEAQTEGGAGASRVGSNFLDGL